MYSARITRAAPMAVAILIDQSGSMQERMGGAHAATKAQAVARTVNDLLTELVCRSTRSNEVAPYFDIAVIGYGGAGIRPLVADRGGFTGIASLAALDIEVKQTTRELTMDDGRRVVALRREHRWIEPRAEGDTPMLGALREAGRLISKWCAAPAHRHCYPPVVFNITDGEATDAPALLAAAERIKGLGTDDGGTLLFNAHIASPQAGGAVLFPTGRDSLPTHRYAGLLYEMASPLPPVYVQEIYGHDSSGCRAMGYNADISQLASLLEIGSITVNRFG